MNDDNPQSEIENGIGLIHFLNQNRDEKQGAGCDQNGIKYFDGILNIGVANNAGKGLEIIERSKINEQ